MKKTDSARLDGLKLFVDSCRCILTNERGLLVYTRQTILLQLFQLAAADFLLVNWTVIVLRD